MGFTAVRLKMYGQIVPEMMASLSFVTVGLFATGRVVGGGWVRRRLCVLVVESTITPWTGETRISGQDADKRDG